LPYGLDLDQVLPCLGQFNLGQFRLGLYLAGALDIQVNDVRCAQVLGGVGDHVAQQIELATALYLHWINAG
jgi:hypothetical protein